MPVNPANFRGRYDDAKVAAAGPTMNLLLASLAVVLYVAVRGFGGGAWMANVRMPEPLYGNLAMFLFLGVVLNLVLFLFNLVPIPPLDGWRIATDFIPAYRRLWEREQAQPIGMVAFLLLFYFGADYIWGYGGAAAGEVVRWAVRTFAAGSAQPMSP
jgi:Zn-dependent protease